MRNVLFILFSLLLLTCNSDKHVRLISTLPENNVFLQEESLNQVGFLLNGKDEILIDPEDTFQNVEGVGAALTHASAYVMHQQPEERRDSILKVLFTPEGIGINYTRLCIGASDFSPDLFSYSEKEDFKLNNFDLSRDRTDVIPVLKEILRINPGLHIMASPWSPPGWMKTSGSMVGGRLRTDCYGVFADYLIKYIQGYQQEGIHIESITVQNEPLYGDAAYSCMDMSSEEQKVFIRDYLGPKMTALGLKTKIILYDHNCDHPEYPINILNDTVARKYIAGSGFHLYGGEISALCKVKEMHPDKNLYFTEQSGGGWAPDFSENIRWYVGNLFAGAMNCWSRNVLLWNLVLDENAGPKNFGCQDCYGVLDINSKNGSLTHRGEYYAIAHYGKVVQPNALRIFSSEIKDMQNIAFRNPDGSVAMLTVFRGKESRKMNIIMKDRKLTYTFRPGEICSFLFN